MFILYISESVAYIFKAYSQLINLQAELRSKINKISCVLHEVLIS